MKQILNKDTYKTILCVYLVWLGYAAYKYAGINLAGIVLGFHIFSASLGYLIGKNTSLEK